MPLHEAASERFAASSSDAGAMSKGRGAAPHPACAARAPRGLLVVLVCVAAVCLFVRLRLIDMPLERDEGEFGYTAQLVLAGDSPYRAYNYKLPGVAYAYALSFLAFGDTVRGVRLALLAANAAAVVFLFLLARRLYGPRVAAIAAASYALASLDSSVLGHAAHATQFANACGLAGLWAADAGGLTEAKRRPARFFWAGLFFGFALLMKQHAIFFLPLGLFQIALADARCAGWRPRVRAGVLLCCGASLPYLAVAWVAAAQGAFSTFWTWTVTYAAAATSTIGLGGGWEGLKLSLGGLFEAFAWLWAAAGAGFVLNWRGSRSFGARAFPVVYFLLAAPAVSAGLYFRGHYFILLLPPACLAAGLCCEGLRDALERRGFGRATGSITLLFAVCLAVSLVTHRDFFFTATPERLSRAIYGGNPFVESPALSAAIGQRTRPEERIAVLGAEAQIYFYARRRAATGYIYMYGLTDNGPYKSAMQDQMLEELTAAAPRIVVFAGNQASWGLGDVGLRPFFERVDAFLARGYELVGYLEIGPETTQSFWGPDAKAALRDPVNPLLVYERKL